MLMVDLVLFGPIGLTVWAVQMAWIPITAAGIVNGIGHYWGYRNFSCEDASRNIVPWGIIIGGEELHNNHHAYAQFRQAVVALVRMRHWLGVHPLPRSAVGLAKVRKVAPRIRFDREKLHADLETLQSVITHRYAVLTSYARSLKQAFAERSRRPARACAARRARGGHARACAGCAAGSNPMAATFRRATGRGLPRRIESSKALQTIYAMRQELTALWERSNDSREQLLARLQDWCHRAETSDIVPLQQLLAATEELLLGGGPPRNKKARRPAGFFFGACPQRSDQRARRSLT